MPKSGYTVLTIYLPKALRDKVSLVAMAERGRDAALSPYIRDLLQKHTEEHYDIALRKLQTMLIESKDPPDK